MMSLEESEERGIGCYRGMGFCLPWVLATYTVIGLIAWAFWPA